LSMIPCSAVRRAWSQMGTVIAGHSKWDVRIGPARRGDRAADIRQRPVLRTVHDEAEATGHAARPVPRVS
jgi:hypothetical protein